MLEHRRSTLPEMAKPGQPSMHRTTMQAKRFRYSQRARTHRAPIHGSHSAHLELSMVKFPTIVVAHSNKPTRKIPEVRSPLQTRHHRVTYDINCIPGQRHDSGDRFADTKLLGSCDVVVGSLTWGFGRNAVSCLRFGLSKVQDEEGCTALRMSRVFAAGLGDQNMVIEDVAIETETSRGKRPKTGEVLVFSVRPKASQVGRCSRCRKRCPGYDGGDGCAAMAHPGCWDDEGLSAGRGAAGGMPRGWGGGRACAVGAAGRQAHLGSSRTPARGWPPTPR